MSSTNSTREILERHWTALTEGDLEALLADYAETAVLVTGLTGVSRGRAAIGELLKGFLSAVIPPGRTRFTRERTEVEGELAFITWSAESDSHRILSAADTFVVRDGRIIAQTSSGQILTRE